MIRCDVKTGYGFSCSSAPKFRVAPEYAIGRVYSCSQHLAQAVITVTHMCDPGTAAACARVKVTYLEWDLTPGDGNEVSKPGDFYVERTDYIRSATGLLHLKGKGGTSSYTNCGLTNSIGREAVPLQQPHPEEKHCRKCFPDWKPLIRSGGES